jgi:hypothetical protein
MSRSEYTIRKRNGAGWTKRTLTRVKPGSEPGKEHVGFTGNSRFHCHASRKTVMAMGNMNRTDGRLRSRAGPGRLKRTRRRMRALDVGNDTCLAFALGQSFDNDSSKE